MKRAKVPERYWRGGHPKGGPPGAEYHHEPSAHAQEFWYYVVVMGRALTPLGFQYQHDTEDRFLLHYIRRGELWHTIRNQTRRARAGTVCLMDLREPVRYGNDRAKPADNWWVCFGGQDVPDTLAHLGVDAQPLFEGVDTQRFEKLFLELLALTRSHPPAYEARADGILRLLLAELFAARSDEAELEIDLVKLPVQIAVLSQPVRDVIRYIARFYNGDHLTYKVICGLSGMSVYHFARLFRRETGMPPMKYLSAYRIEKAKRVLVATNHPMGKVAAMVGIPDQFKFSHLFHKITGLTPRRYREKAIRATQKTSITAAVAHRA